ncbi:MAG: hypothetical protein J0I84_23515 [Terrimonas sp.]|nr:hypothetical protein [Terrimonas sp.]
MKKQAVFPVLIYLVATMLILASVFLIYHFMLDTIELFAERTANNFPERSIVTR